jgi:transposase
MLDGLEKNETRVSSFRRVLKKMHSQGSKENALFFRVRGYSLREIANITNVSRSTLSVWLKDVAVSDEEAKERLRKRTKNYGTARK